MKLISNDLIEMAALTATSSADGYPADNLKNDLRGLKWRSTTSADQTITATWVATQTIGAVALALTNLSDSATVRVQLFTNSTDTISIYNSGAIVNSGEYFSVFFSALSCKKITIIISDGSNPDGFFYASRLVAGAFFAPAIDEESINISFDHDSVISKIGGNIQIEARQVKKIISSSMPYLDPLEQKTINDIKNYNSKYLPVFFAVGNEQIYGYLQELDSKLYVHHAYNFAITIKEI